jgi:lipopolysaccharide/colanic/teichoic acid biosynthesis glycosyltransferase
MPLIIFVALCIKAESRGPVFCRMAEIDDDGSALHLIRFRTAYSDGVPSNDFGNVTCVGVVLPKVSWDEIPILFNVLAGDLSLAEHPMVYNGKIEFYDLFEKIH